MFADSMGAKSPPERASRLKSALHVAFQLLAWAIVLLLAVVTTLHWSKGTFNAQVTGYLIGSVLTPVGISFLVAWLINRKRDPKMGGLAQHSLAALLALFISLMSFAGSARSGGPDSPLHHVGHLLKQASGKEEVIDSHWYDEPSRQFFRDMIQFNKEYTDAVHVAPTSSLASLYMPESYSTRTRLAQTVSELQGVLEIDKKYQSVDPLFTMAEVNVKRAQASSEEKDDFLRGMRNGAQKVLGPRTKTFESEEQWLQGSIELYKFCLSHFADYTVRGKKLFFRSESSRLKFEELQSQAIEFRKAARQAKTELEASRSQAMSTLGVSPSDIVLPKLAKK